MATFSLDYQTEAALTISPASLASSATLVAGRESTVIDNGTDENEDFILSGFITTGTSPTGGVIGIYLYAQLDDTPTYHTGGILDGTDSAETFASEQERAAACVAFDTIPVSTTSNIGYPVKAGSVKAAFGGVLPKRWGVFVAHSTGVALHATGSNHKLVALPVKRRSA